MCRWMTVMAELERRTAQSGLAEKASRRDDDGASLSRRAPDQPAIPDDDLSPYRVFPATNGRSCAPTRR